jgi:hypothetical protein
MSTTALFLLLILACPLMMLLMHRGGHGGHDHGAHGQAREPESTDDLRHRRDELDREIAARDGR